MPRSSKPKRAHRPRKQKKIRSSLMRGIIVIMLLTVLIPVLAYNLLPEWLYYASPATRLWIMSQEITSMHGTAELLQALRDAENHYDTAIEIRLKDGTLIYSSKALISKLPEDLSQAAPVSEDYTLRYDTKYGSKMENATGFLVKEYRGRDYSVTFLDCYFYLDSGECVDMYMQVSQVSTTMKITMIVSFLAIMFSVALALAVISSYIKRITKPVNEMVETTKNMARLDFSKKCPESSILELNSLSESINELSGALDTALGNLQTQNRKLEEDIANERTIDNLRQTFISGISHELKTPIAIIRGYAEGAKMFYAAGDAATADVYCDTIMDESERMNEMIMKLLEITKYSSGAYEPQREDFELRPFVQDWFDRNASLLAEKGVQYENTVPENIFGNGDRLILESVLNNYLSNALSHVEGENRITVRCEDAGAAWRVCVFNTGKPIAAKDIDKIWDSFYRADKSLSRSQGRFGLGLSIVAAIQNLHGEDYGVQNLLTGVQFWFDVKKADLPQNG